MNKFFIIMIAVFSTYTYSGDGVGNGGGIAENNFVFAYKTLGEYIEHSLKKSAAELSGEEKIVLRKIKRSLREEYNTKKQLKFLSGDQYPHIFIYPFGEVRIAVTGSRVGSLIYINTDLLYRKVGDEIMYITLSQAISVLVHEFGHHHGVKDELFLNTLGAKVSKSVYKKFERRPLRDSKEIYLDFINLGESQFSLLQLSDGLNSFNLSSDLENKVKCPQAGEIKGVEIWQSSWSKYSSPSWYLKNELVVYCLIDDVVNPLSEFEYFIYPTFVKRNNKIYIQEVNTFVKECDQRNTSCLAKQQNVFNFIENKKYRKMEEE